MMSFHNNHLSSSKDSFRETEQYSAPPSAYQSHSETDHDDYASDAEEADHYDHDADTSHQDDAVAERELDKELGWANRKPHPTQEAPLRLPVLIPQVAPGMTELFQRGWAPDLAAHDVYPEEFLQFIDHLNICKTASPPLQVLNLAGRVAGFVPIHIAHLAGMAASMVATGGMVAVARIRIARYLKRANAEYFVPRGLVASIVSQKVVHQVTGQHADAPMLLDGNNAYPDPTQQLNIVQQRMQAFGGSIARVVYDGLPPPQQEQSTLDRIAAKMNARKANRGMKEDGNGRLVSKEQRKFEKKRAEAEEEAQEIHEKAERKMAKKPKDRAKIEADMRKDLAKLDEDIHSEEEDYLEKAGKGGKKMEKKLRRLMFIAVQDLASYQRQQQMQQRSSALA